MCETKTIELEPEELAKFQTPSNIWELRDRINETLNAGAPPDSTTLTVLLLQLIEIIGKDFDK